MADENKSSIRRVQGIILFAFILGTAIFFGFFSRNVYSYNYETLNVTTKVNVTNARPDVVGIRAATSFNTTNNITLLAGSFTTVVCNASIRDYNGFNDIDEVNATFYYYLNSSGDQDDGNEHYTNSSCTQIENDGQYIANYTCSFQVQYFAFNGTWHCNITANDTSGYAGSGNNTTRINAVYALNVTDMIDYGNLAIGDYSPNVTANITNFGNMPINISVLGYGRTQGDGIGLVCAQGSNISVNNQRFYNVEVDWANKRPLSSTNQDVNITLPKQIDDATQVFNTTHWQLYVPPNPFGVCNGTVRFTATAP